MRHKLVRATLLLTNAVVLISWTKAETQSDLREPYLHVWGAKSPNSSSEGDKAVYVSAPVPRGAPKGYTDLLPYIISAPDQEDAGSCLYMSLTGTAEWFLAKANPTLPRTMNGPIDLSERFLMSSAGIEEDSNGVENWRTDTIFLFNQSGHSVINASYPFSKGWFKRDRQGIVQLAQENEQGAEYGTSVNWAESPDISDAKRIQLPEFKREIIFADSTQNQWNIGVMPDNIVETVKQRLRQYKAPVQVIYNHYGYWHAVNIVGYDDEADSESCPFVTKMPAYFDKEAADATKQASTETNQAERDRLLGQAKKFTKMSKQVTNSMESIGGCSGKGMFYVRDSLYTDPNGPDYDYDPSRSDDNSKWGKPYIMREYEWLRVVGNHAIQILPVRN